MGSFDNMLSFPNGETSLGSGIPSHFVKGDVPCLSIPPHVFLHHTMRTRNKVTGVLAITLGMSPPMIYRGKLIANRERIVLNCT